MKKIQQKGFTLIELLVVIAVLGVMATALVAAINPLTKINQAKDSQIKSDISSIANAMQAYYTVQPLTGGSPFYPTSVGALTAAGELRAEPKQPGGTASYVVATSPSTCSTDCTSVAVYASMKATANRVWCWKSDGTAPTSTTVAGCTAP
jgi:prepilin-type N-terminal cleavage/methylation domain-containing protein